jgi:hypothetical protein
VQVVAFDRDVDFGPIMQAGTFLGAVGAVLDSGHDQGSNNAQDRHDGKELQEREAGSKFIAMAHTISIHMAAINAGPLCKDTL